MNYLFRLLILSFFSVLLLVACKKNYAPVDDAWAINQEKAGRYIVQQGDTLYAIAWRYNMDYRTLANQNHLSSPYIVKVGQIIFINPPTHKTSASAITSKNISDKTIHWIWPAKGRIITHYSPRVGQKGINIAGKKGEPILAAATGKVAYAGHGLRGYGNLVIIKHNDEFLSAYAHNQTLLVREGDEVQAGQKIATMGNSESKMVMLHFEIREAGKSVNPLLYIHP